MLFHTDMKYTLGLTVISKTTFTSNFVNTTAYICIEEILNREI